MALVWQSSWFWLMICSLLLLIAGCVVLRSSSPPLATQAPNASTPRVVALPSLFPPPPILIPPDIVRSQQTNVRYGDPNASPPGSITVDSPRCYELPNLEYSCLGILHNNSSRAIGDTSILLTAYDSEGKIINEQFVTPEQRLIPAGAAAPYRMIIPSRTALDDPDTVVFSAQIARVFAPDETLTTLEIMESHVQVSANGRYRISAIIANNSTETVQNLSLIATLFENKWGIVGYNTLDIKKVVRSGESTEIQFDLIPHILPDHLTHHLHVEGAVEN